MIIDELDNKALKYGMHVRLVNENDAEEILKLRTNISLSIHLHETDANIEKQIKYISEYKLREQSGQEYYFAFLKVDNLDPIGFYRIYNIDYINKIFTIGSWIFEKTTLVNLPVFADILMKEFGFEQLNLNTCYFDVRRKNKKVIRYHNLFSPIFIKEDEEENNYFYLEKKDFEKNKMNILNTLL